MKNKITVAIFFGGQSAEHEVSVVSGRNVTGALDQQKYHILLVYIAKNGKWYLFDQVNTFLNCKDPEELLESIKLQQVILDIGESRCLFDINNTQKRWTIDVAFPVLHGSHGEDGTIQGLFELANVPYVGPGVLGSAACMDKEITKRILEAHGLPIVPWFAALRDEANKLSYEDVSKELGSTFFIKPANTGSSVGISKVKTKAQFESALKIALDFDHKIIFEQAVSGQEIEISVLGNEQPDVSLPGRVIPHHEFYDYEAKYIDPNGASFEIPAKLAPQIIKRIQTLAAQAFIALSCEGMARIDFFLIDDNTIYINELNTIPGFTQISMYPKMWAVSGLAYNQLLDRLIELAQARFERDRVLIAAKRMRHTIDV